MSEELYQAGIYKDNETHDPDYEGCTDNIRFDNYIIIVDQNIGNSIDSYHPEVMKNSDYRVFIELLSRVVTKLDGYSNFIKECYNFDIYDSELIYKLSSLLNINYPFDYNYYKLELLVKNYIKIRKIRGGEKAIRMLLRLIDRSESDLYSNDIDDTIISVDSDGTYHISNSRIESIDFAKYMIRKVIEAGRNFTFDTTLDHNKHYSFSTDTLEDILTHAITKYVFPEDYFLVDHVYYSSSVSLLSPPSSYKSATDSSARDDLTEDNPSAIILDSNRGGASHRYPY